MLHESFVIFFFDQKFCQIIQIEQKCVTPQRSQCIERLIIFEKRKCQADDLEIFFRGLFFLTKRRDFLSLRQKLVFQVSSSQSYNQFRRRMGSNTSLTNKVEDTTKCSLETEIDEVDFSEGNDFFEVSQTFKGLKKNHDFMQNRKRSSQVVKIVLAIEEPETQITGSRFTQKKLKDRTALRAK